MRACEDDKYRPGYDRFLERYLWGYLEEASEGEGLDGGKHHLRLEGIVDDLHSTHV